MSLILNGTDGLSDVDGTAGTPAIRGTDANTGIFFPAADTIAFSEGGAEAMRIDSDGDVGIGTTSPATKLHVTQTNDALPALQLQHGDGDFILMEEGGGTDLFKFTRVTGTNDLQINNITANNIRFATNNTERMRITSAGAVCMGVTSALITGATLSLASGGDNTSLALKGDSGTNCGSIRYTSYTTGANRFQLASNENNWFLFNADGTSYAYVGQSITSWSFGSDRRIKKDIVDLPYGLETILAIQPRKYKLLSNNSDDIGFVAQELKLVVPEAVEGEEIPYSEDDTPMEKASKTMGVSKDKLIPILVKALQELNAKVDAQAAEIAALKAAS